MNDIQSKIERMKEHDIDAIKSGIESNAAFLRLNAIMYGAKERINDNDFINKIRVETKNNKDSFMGVPMSAFAKASMEILGFRTYSRSDETVAYCKKGILSL